MQQMGTVFWAKVACHRLRRHLEWRLRPLPWAARLGDPCDFPETVAARTSPLKRAPSGAIAAYTDEKINNLKIACEIINGLVIAPGQVFSFCRLVGRTTRARGYLPALELLEGELRPEVGGGLCQLSNLLFLLAVEVNAEIVERHRHSYDLFRDVERSVPFGCGATVFYNYVDFQFRNTLDSPIMLNVGVETEVLRGEIRAQGSLPFQVRIVETDHRFFRRGGDIIRANRVWRETCWKNSPDSTRELLLTNECKVLYPADDLVGGG